MEYAYIQPLFTFFRFGRSRRPVWELLVARMNGAESGPDERDGERANRSEKGECARWRRHEDSGLVSRAKSARLRGGRDAETEKIGEEQREKRKRGRKHRHRRGGGGEKRRGEERPTSAQAALTARVTLVALAGDYSAAARRDDPLLGAFSAPRALRNRVSILRLSERQ